MSPGLITTWTVQQRTTAIGERVSENKCTPVRVAHLVSTHCFSEIITLIFDQLSTEDKSSIKPTAQTIVSLSLDRSLWYTLASQLKDILGGFPERHTKVVAERVVRRVPEKAT